MDIFHFFEMGLLKKIGDYIPFHYFLRLVCMNILEKKLEAFWEVKIFSFFFFGSVDAIPNNILIFQLVNIIIYIIIAEIDGNLNNAIENIFCVPIVIYSILDVIRLELLTTVFLVNMIFKRFYRDFRQARRYEVLIATILTIVYVLIDGRNIPIPGLFEDGFTSENITSGL